ncbi:POTRA domain-containing protein [Catalinimonas niigatensis]|uniref:POTRA domain-containing protein n=1 Tax=Catalinimonas niigatensis TaxID=1397264 RepID=UPI002665AFCB|nr:POTRA domain-containing protein [Catalinimonas niigatensis]WPP50567.1 POTRA domain-containing protein [Catalinimonas niigatensis]
MTLLVIRSIPSYAQSLNWSDSTSTVKVRQQPLDKNQLLTVDKIFIIGNRRTKERIILRELNINEGESLTFEELDEALKLDRRKLMNTQLFLDVKLSMIQLENNVVDIIVRVAERWYTIPSPFFKLADRNFNVWLSSQNRDWNRVEYGLKFFKYNFRGLNEQVYFFFQLGFTRQLAVRYKIPYIDKAQKNGLEFGFSFSETANINYTTEGHRLIFTDSLKEASQSKVGLIGWRFRPSFYKNHGVDLRYYDVSITDTIQALNPDYFQNNGTRQQYFMLSYSFANDHRDFVGYPLKGYRWSAEIAKLGLGIFDDLNLFRLQGEAAKYIPLGKGFYFAGIGRGYFSTPKVQPYANLTGLGFGQRWIRGYELDALEGQAYLMQQNTISKKIFAREFDISQVLPIDQFNNVPLAIYVKGYFDHGYLWNDIPYIENKPLANRYLYGYGLGIDIVSFYDFVFRLEHSWKHDGTSGIFFHFNSAF